jgi:hypothetical protein
MRFGPPGWKVAGLPIGDPILDSEYDRLAGSFASDD